MNLSPRTKHLMSENEVQDENSTNKGTPFCRQTYPQTSEKPQRQKSFQRQSQNSLNDESTVASTIQISGNHRIMIAIDQTEDVPGFTTYQQELEHKANESCFNMEQLLDLVSRAEGANNQLPAENPVNRNTANNTINCNVSQPCGRKIENISGGSNSKTGKRNKKKKLKEGVRNNSERVDKMHRRESESARMVEEVSGSRSSFNRNRDRLPAIGTLPEEARVRACKLPEVKTQLNVQDNNVLDVIRMNETRVRDSTYLREISQEYINASVGLIESSQHNEAIDIIEKHEQENSKLYGMLNGNYTVGYLRAREGRSEYEFETAQSRSSSVASRRGAA